MKNFGNKKQQNYNKNNNNKKYNDILKNDFLIISAMEKYDYYPKTSYFENNKYDKIIPDAQNFEKIFPKFISLFKKLDTEFSEYIHKKECIKGDLNKDMRNFILDQLYKYDTEVINFAGRFWDLLDKKVKSHSIIFLYMANEYINKNKLSEYDKNILYWAILFHDIGKFHEMNTFYKEDYSKNVFVDESHPFKSAIVFI